MEIIWCKYNYTFLIKVIKFFFRLLWLLFRVKILIDICFISYCLYRNNAILRYLIKKLYIIFFLFCNIISSHFSSLSSVFTNLNMCYQIAVKKKIIIILFNALTFINIKLVVLRVYCFINFCNFQFRIRIYQARCLLKCRFVESMIFLLF